MNIPFSSHPKPIIQALAIVLGLAIFAFAERADASEGGGGDGGSGDMFESRANAKKVFRRKRGGLNNYFRSIRSAPPKPKWKKKRKTRKAKRKTRRARTVTRAPVNVRRTPKTAPRTVAVPSTPSMTGPKTAGPGCCGPAAPATVRAPGGNSGLFDTPMPPRSPIKAPPPNLFDTPAPPRGPLVVTPPNLFDSPAQPARNQTAVINRPSPPTISAPSGPSGPPSPNASSGPTMGSVLGTLNTVSGTIADGIADVVKAPATTAFRRAGGKIEVIGTTLSVANIATATVDTALSNNAEEYSENYNQQLRTSVGAVASAVGGATLAGGATWGMAGLVGVVSAPALAAGLAAAAVVSVTGAYLSGVTATAAYDRFASAGVRSFSRRHYENNLGRFTSRK